MCKISNKAKIYYQGKCYVVLYFGYSSFEEIYDYEIFDENENYVSKDSILFTKVAEEYKSTILDHHEVTEKLSGNFDKTTY